MKQEYTDELGRLNISQACFILNITSTSGIWQGENPLTESLPSLINQLALIVFVTRSLYIILKPLRQPRIVTDILGGVLLGPSFFGKTSSFSKMFPVKTIITLETVAYIALDFYIFLFALEMDIKSIKRASKRELAIGIAGALLPMGMGIGLFFFAQRLLHFNTDPSGCLLWGLVLTITGFPVVSRILEELNLVNSGIGRMAKSIAMMNDICSWILMAIFVPLRLRPRTADSDVIATVAFILICIYAVRPALVWIIRRTSIGNNEVYSEYYLCFALVGVVLCSFVTEICGTYSIVGSFVFGIMMPSRELGSVLLEKLETFVSGIMLPLFFAISGIRINLFVISNWLLAFLVITLACFCKILSTVVISLYYNMPAQESLVLGLVMNTKGILAIIILNLGWDKKVLHEEECVLIVVATVIMTGLVGPILASIYRPSRRVCHFKGRTIQRAKIGAELRILACLHSVNNVSAIINLLDISNATKQSPICVFTLRLVEATDRASAMFIVHGTRKDGGYMHNNSENSSSDQIISVFENLENQNTAISVQSLTVLSPFSTIHEDVCNLADDKRIAFMILPFHKQFGYNLTTGNRNESVREFNMNILRNAPCSVGIFVSRELGLASLDDSKHRMHHLVMFFIGGPDDREALAYAWRMSASTHPMVNLAVVRLIPGTNVKETEYSPFIQRQRELDTEFINEFRVRTEGEQHVSYSEKMVKNAEETIAVLRAMDHRKVDLYIVGRQVLPTPVTAGMLEWSNCPEIGAIGDLLVFSDFAGGSVLVVQQYAGRAARDASMMSIHGWSSTGTESRV